MYTSCSANIYCLLPPRLDIVVEPWIEGLWGALGKVLSLSNGSESSSVATDNPSVTAGCINPEYTDQTVDPHSVTDVDDPNSTAISDDNPFTTVDAGVVGPNSTSQSTDSHISNGQQVTVEIIPDNLVTDFTEHLHIAPPPLPSRQFDSTSPAIAPPPSSSAPGVEVRGQGAGVGNVRMTAVRTCSSVLVGVALTLPTIPPPYICIQLSQV